MVEVHYYDPYDFTLNPNGACNFWGAPFPDSGGNCNWAYENWVDTEFAKVRAKWVDQGVPVILGEYGVETRPGKEPRGARVLERIRQPCRGAERHQDFLLGQRRPEHRQHLQDLRSQHRRRSSTSRCSMRSCAAPASAIRV